MPPAIFKDSPCGINKMPTLDRKPLELGDAWIVCAIHNSRIAQG